MKRFLFIILLTILITINVSPVNAEIGRAEVSVVGMACPFCAYGVEKKLKKVDGVKSITINMREGTATLTAKKGESVNIGLIPEAIEDSGFSPGKITITARGNIKTDNQDRLLLTVTESRETFLLKKIKGDMKKQILKYSDTDSVIEVSGLVGELSDRTWKLSVDVIDEVLR